MNIRLPEISPKSEVPFKECELQREPYANILTQMVKTYAEGFVLAINNEWGTGKTTFVKMWREQLSNEGFETLYFNAWENDFEDGALTALMSELALLKQNKTEDLFKNVVEKGAILTKNILPIVLKAAAFKYLDSDVLKELFDKIADNSEELLQQQIKEYTEKREGLIDFKDSLKRYVKAVSHEKPIVFIIDELDRCRPNYAVDVLEKIKHFFSVPGIVFVLSIDKAQLGHAIRGVYGSDLFDADEYLRRFIDVEYSLPEPDTDLFCRYLFNYFEFGKFFNSQERLNDTYINFDNDSEDFIRFSANLFKSNSVPLRLQEKIYAHSRIVLNSFGNKQLIYPSLFVALVYMKQKHNQIYQNIVAKKYTIQQVIDKYESIVPETSSQDELRELIWVEAQIAYFYYNDLKPRLTNNLYQTNDKGNREYLVKCKLNFHEEENFFENLLESLMRRREFLEMKISILTDRIDLMKHFKIN